MQAEDALEEVEFVRSLGVEIRTGVEVAPGASADALLREHDAVFLALGLGLDTRLGIPGEDGPGVAGAVEWIERMKIVPGASVAQVQRAVVIGGGNTAIDAVRELLGLGVHGELLYRRTRADMSGYAHELEEARLAGAVLVERAVPRRFERDASGALTGVTLEGGEVRPCDLAIVAIGQAPTAAVARAFPGVEVDAKRPRGRRCEDRRDR